MQEGVIEQAGQLAQSHLPAWLFPLISQIFRFCRDEVYVHI